MKTVEEFLESKSIDSQQIVAYYVPDGIGDGIDINIFELMQEYADQQTPVLTDAMIEEEAEKRYPIIKNDRKWSIRMLERQNDWGKGAKWSRDYQPQPERELMEALEKIVQSYTDIGDYTEMANAMCEIAEQALKKGKE